jgi:hypothetical protein
VNRDFCLNATKGFTNKSLPHIAVCIASNGKIPLTKKQGYLQSQVEAIAGTP